jgi:hypothetical protein
MGFIGADIDQLKVLAAALVSTGGQFAASSTAIVGSVNAAAEELRASMAALAKEAKTLSDDSMVQMGELKKEAQGTTWTGDLRAKHDAALANLDKAAVDIHNGMDVFIVDAKAVVDGKLSTNLADTAAKVAKFGAEAQSVAQSMSATIAAEASGLDAAFNG